MAPQLLRGQPTSSHCRTCFTKWLASAVGHNVYDSSIHGTTPNPINLQRDRAHSLRGKRVPVAGSRSPVDDPRRTEEKDAARHESELRPAMQSAHRQAAMASRDGCAGSQRPPRASRPHTRYHDPMPLPDPSDSAVLISASRRCDIPRYYARWFGARLAQGVAEYRTVFGVEGRASLAHRDVLGYLFWTRDARPLFVHLGLLREVGMPYAFQFTVNGYGREIEPHRPSLRGSIESFRAVARTLPSPRSIQWRYDPILLSERYSAEYHCQRFAQIAQQLADCTRVVNVSVVEPYLKAIRRLPDPTLGYRAADPVRHKTVARNYPDLPQAEGVPELLHELAAIATNHGIELRVCCNPEYSSELSPPLPRSQCIGAELFTEYACKRSQAVTALSPAPSRSSCRCLRAVDIGMDNTCLSGCRYCYVTTSLQAAVENYRQHDPRSPRLR